MDSLTFVYPRSTSSTSLPVSSLVFMDDSTLVSSSQQGMEALLSTTEDFYALNNTSANHSKYILTHTGALSSSLAPVEFVLAPSLLHHTRTISITPIGSCDSFRFLGVWFNLSGSSSFRITQAAADYKAFTSVLFSKLLTDQQLVYLHNSVLISKVAFRLQTTFLFESQALDFFRFKRLFKSKISL